MYKFNQIFKMDLVNLFTNPIWLYGLAFPVSARFDTRISGKRQLRGGGDVLRLLWHHNGIEFKFADEMQKYAPLYDDLVMNG